jgi:2,4-dienoyl-CoA reductase-like NADH-dependent reductase (Old Yellow Enzyme family)
MVAKNRIALAPMTHYSSKNDGHSIPEEVPYISRRSKSVGMVMTCAYAVSWNARVDYGEPFANDDIFLPDLKKIASAIKSQGALAVMQLHHGGNVCPAEVCERGGVVGPSAIRTPGRSTTDPRELTLKEIDDIIVDFGQAAVRAAKAGFDGVTLHGAFGYLLQQFTSPYCNRREDKWGGSQEKRFAFPLAVLSEVKRVIAKNAGKPFLIGYRFTPEEALQPGLTMADALAFSDALASAGLDFIDVLLNNYKSKPRQGVPDLMTRRLTQIKKQIAGRCVMLGGGAIFSADNALDALQDVDMITLGRAMIMDPEWIEKVQQGREGEIVSKLGKDVRESLDIPLTFWKTIWAFPGWFPGTAPAKL